MATITVLLILLAFIVVGGFVAGFAFALSRDIIKGIYSLYKNLKNA